MYFYSNTVLQLFVWCNQEHWDLFNFVKIYDFNLNKYGLQDKAHTMWHYYYVLFFLVTLSNDSFDYMAISGGKTLGFDWTQQHRG